MEGKNYEIVVVNDNSSDNTRNIAEEFRRKDKRIRTINRKKGKNGMGFSLLEGSSKAKGGIIIWLMADRSDDLDAIHMIINKINNGYDMVIGSRYMKGGSRGDLSALKAMLSRGYTLIAGIFFGFKVHDITNAFRGFRKEILKKIKLNSGDFAISPEFAIKAYINGYKIGEAPTSYFNRVGGHSNFQLINHGIKYIKLLKYSLKRK